VENGSGKMAGRQNYQTAGVVPQNMELAKINP
jgi:hypothetical protein